MKKTALAIFLFMALYHAGFTQKIRIMGSVRSTIDSSVLSGVSVVVKGSPGGTTTNMEGQYSIATAENAVLVFSFSGYAPQEVRANGQSRIDIFLQQSEKNQLNEVVVTTALGIKKQQKTLG